MNVVRSASLFLIALLPACSSTPDGYLYPPAPLPTNVVTEDIDTNGVPTVLEPGKSVAVNVEYRTGGTWRISVSCDTDVSQYDCAWDLVASVAQDKSITLGSRTDLESDDQVLQVDPGAVRLLLSTASDLDAVDLTADAGETLGLDVILDGYHYDPADSRNPPIRWVKRGADELAPTNPVDLQPTEP